MSGEIISSADVSTAGIRLSPSSGRKARISTAKLSMNQITTYRWSLLEDVSAYRDAGIEAIGVWRPKLSQFGDEKGIDLIQDSGLDVSSLSWAGGFTGSNGFSYNEALDDAREATCTAAELRSSCLVVVSGARGCHTANHARRLMVDGMKSLADFAAQQRVVLAVQPMHHMFARDWTFLSTLDQTLDVLDRCGHDSVRLAFDAYHLWQEPRLLERIPEIAPLVSTVRLSDWREPPRSLNDRCFPGEGEIPLDDIVGAFIDAGYNGYFEFDLWSEEIWSSDYDGLLKRLRSQFKTMTRRAVSQ